MDTKVLINYDLKRGLTYAKKEFKLINKGTEEFYNPQLNNMEHYIYNEYERIPISDNSLKTVIEIIIAKVRSKINDFNYDFSEVATKEELTFAEGLMHYFDPFKNKDILDSLKNIDINNPNDLQKLYNLPIACLIRIYDSIDFWHQKYGNNGYYRMLEEMVLPIMEIGNHPYILNDDYINIKE